MGARFYSLPPVVHLLRLGPVAPPRAARTQQTLAARQSFDRRMNKL